MAEGYKYRHLSVKLPPLWYEPPPPGLVAMLDQLARDCLEVTAIDFDVFGSPATRVSLKPTEERSMSDDLLTASGALLPLKSEAQIADLQGENTYLRTKCARILADRDRWKQEARVALDGEEKALEKAVLREIRIAALEAENADKDARIKGQTEMLTLLDRKLNLYMRLFVSTTNVQPKVLEHNPFREFPVDRRRMGPLV
jgi:hypothetical protein